MVSPLISTKLYIPKPRAGAVVRQRLKERLDHGMHRKLSLIVGSAGYGKTTLVSEWLSNSGRPVAWLSLDEGDNEVSRFLSYLIAALHTVAGQQELHAANLLQSPQSPSIASIVAVLINDLTSLPEPIVMVLDDYQVIRAESVHDAVSMLLERMPPGIHMVILAREEPELYLSQLRIRDQVTDLGVHDLRFNDEESALFLNNTMRLGLSRETVTKLAKRTEGWVAGLQIAALTLQGQSIAEPLPSTISSNQRLLFDYLVNEVLLKQPEAVQKFLCYTSILDRLCGSLCEAVLLDDLTVSGDQLLQSLERANLFIVPLDQEQRWYRYHHLFAEMLHHQFLQRMTGSEEIVDVSVLHIRASVWYEEQGLYVEAFRHAVAANDIEKASRLAVGNEMPLHLLGEVTPVLNWLELLPREELNARPSLWVMYASALLMAGRPTEVEAKLLASEAYLPNTSKDTTQHNNLLGIIATTRAAVAAITVTDHSEPAELKLRAIEDALQTTGDSDKTKELVGQIPLAHVANEVDKTQSDIVITQCRLALELLHPNLLPVRITAHWMLGVACQLRGYQSEAYDAYLEVLVLSRKMGASIIEVMANVGLGSLMEADQQLTEAEKFYHRALFINADLPMSAICEAYLGLARISYGWKEFEQAMQHVQKSAQLARFAKSRDTLLSCKILAARIKLAQHKGREASELLADAKKLARELRLLHQLSEIEAILSAEKQLHVASPLYIEPLTKRELEVLQLIAHGYSNQEIGQKLYLAVDTVKGHNRRIFAKLQVGSRTEAIAIARQLGIIEA